ncbi:hypothetical protein [Flavobacterium sp. MK4S-17]|uniref:hypothetical protein n=1 Tax=Flavobacterium sp. MK4S-17 TaxID=2543737 RepID=UPI001357FB1F|nr:hypothetical protein [Flavobacterium sp. MK4S-17]
MKNIALTLMLALGLSLNAQVNKNVTKETKTTTVTVNNGQEKKKLVKQESTDAVQDIELKDAESKKLNKDIKETPVAVTKSTTISGDGIPTQQLGSTTYYTMDGQDYVFITDRMGYRIATEKDKKYGVLRKTSNDNYIYKTKDKTSIGYFKDNGDFVVETYNDNTDGVTVETYSLKQQ